MQSKNELKSDLSLLVAREKRSQTPYPNYVGGKNSVDIVGTLVMQSISPTNDEPDNTEDGGND